MNRMGRQEPATSRPAGGQWLEGYPGAALLVRDDLTIVAANERGGELAPILMEAGKTRIGELVGRAAGSGVIAADTLELQVGGGEVQFEVTIVPETGSGAYLVLTRDVTLERNLRPALIESRQRYKDLVDISSDFAWEVGPDGTFVFVSAQNALGYVVDELIGRRPHEFVVDAGAYRPLPFVSDQALEGVDLWMRRPDDSLACVAVSSRPIYGEDGTWLGARGVCRDITREREREAALMRARHREQILHYVVRAIRNEVEPQNMLAAAAAAAARALGAAGCRIYRLTETGFFAPAAEFGDVESIGPFDRALAEIEDADTTLERDIGPWQVLGAVTDYRAAINGGLCIWKAASLGGWTDDERFMVNDVADQLGIAIEQINNHERIVRLSRTDALTGLLNRRAFYDEEMPRRLRRLERSPKTAAMFYVDLDNFKLVNDLFGHQRGDEALVALRELLIEHSRPGDLIARIGGDEFVMWLDGIAPDAAQVRARQLVEAGQRLAVFSEHSDMPLGLSVGVAIYDPARRETLDELLARADDAMYSVKRRGKAGFEMAPGSKT
mgnify:CR=1 FL=1